MISPKDVIARYSVEELAETADEYYRRIPDPTPLMVKPFAFLHETPEMLQNLGLLFAGLHLGRTMSVLDFGGGTGWISRYLAQLNCRPICCDVSAAALAIGRRLVAEQPLIGTAVYTPEFLHFNGHRIELDDESVDRIICFDAFHHVPNPRDVIAEFGRVLKPGGIAGFSEPGRQHSRSPQSQYEMQHHRVLENDIVLAEIFDQARAAGFTDLSIRVLTDMAIGLPDYQAMFAGGDKAALVNEIFNQTHNTMFNRSIFFLHKGALRRDSRHHLGLAHELRVDRGSAVAPPGAPLRLQFTITNTGDAHWLHRNTEIFGIVRLGSHLFDAGGKLINLDFTRHDLPQAAAPGETLTMAVEIALPDDRACKLIFDLVAEGVTWFENLGSRPVEVIVRRG